MEPQEYPILTEKALREHDDALVDKVLDRLYQLGVLTYPKIDDFKDCKRVIAEQLFRRDLK